MMRTLATALLCGAAIIAGDVVFRTSLLRHVRPVILTPSEQAVVQPPVEVRWDGPRHLRVLLSITGEAPRDLGTHLSPFRIDGEHFPRDGGYELEVRAANFGDWVRASRRFQVHIAPPAEEEGEEEEEKKTLAAPAVDIKDLLPALRVARTARDRAHQRAKFLREENVALRDESDRLARQLQSVYEAQEDDAAYMADLEGRLARLADELRSLSEENAALRLRLGSVIPCTVWGYYSYPRPQTVPLTRRLLMVSDTRGQVFRAQAECEPVRRADPTAASICFCIGNSWGR